MPFGLRWLALRSIRYLLRRIDLGLAGGAGAAAEVAFDPPGYQRVREFLTSLEGAEQSYLHMHLDRMCRTLLLVPPPRSSGRVLELGAYMHMTPALAVLKNYTVSAAYYGAPGQQDTRTASIGGQEVFRCTVDSFDAERDRFPYDDGAFEGVLACEILEHLVRDPMWMLLEIRRVLEPEGWLLLTTPNCASALSIERAFEGKNPQVFSRYDRRLSGETPHVREYTPAEVRAALASAGFRVELMLTQPGSVLVATWVYDLLEKYACSTDLRGEQIYCLARKAPDAEVERFPAFLYTD